MTQEGRNWLRRIEFRCAQQYGVALWEMQQKAAVEYLSLEEVRRYSADTCGPVIWHMTLTMMDSLLRRGRI